MEPVHRQARILAVDDDLSIRLLLDKYLSGAGHDASIVEDASEAMSLLSTTSFDVVVVDILLPDLKGTELLETIRENYPLTRVILITAKPSFETAAIALRLGAFDYITKPFNRGTLLNPINRAIDVKRLDDENRRLQDENRKHREELEQKVRERTLEVEQVTDRLLAVQEDERSHLSRELHDDLGQALLALKLSLQSSFGKLKEVTPELSHEFNWSLNYLDKIIDRSRQITRNLSPIHLEKLGLIRAVHDMVEALNRDKNKEITVQIDDLNGFFADNWEINVYRLIQESLTNAIKHSQATKIAITAIKNHLPPRMIISIQDNGIGFHPDQLETGVKAGLGIKIMKKRVDLLQGKLFFINTEKKGTEVRIELP